MLTKEQALAELEAVDPKFISEVQKQMFNLVTSAYKDIVDDIYSNVPDCAARSSAIRRILTAKFECIHAIAHYGPKKELSDVKISQAKVSTKAQVSSASR